MNITTRTFAGALALALVAPAQAIDITPELSGSWFNASQNGHGFSLEVLSDDVTQIYWYTYDPLGNSTFLVAVGANDGDTTTATSAYYVSGMVFGEFDPADVVVEDWGSLAIEFHTCSTATLTYDSNMSIDGEAFGSGTIDLVRLTSVQDLKCRNARLAGIYAVEATDANGAFVGAGQAVITTDNFLTWHLDGPGEELGLTALSGSADAFSADGERYPLRAGQQPATINVTLTGFGSAGDVLVWTTDAGITYRARAMNGLYQRTLTAEDLIGSWDLYDERNAVIGNLQVASNGAVSGGDTAGCQYQGGLFAETAQFNQIDLWFNITGCALNTQLYGLGFLEDQESPDGFGRMRLLSTDADGTARVYTLIRDDL